MADQHWLYRIRPTRAEMLPDGPTPREESIIGQHFTYLQGLTERGVLLLAGRTLNTDPSSFGIVIFTASTEDETMQVMRSDPAVDQDVMQADLFPYRIALMAHW